MSLSSDDIKIISNLSPIKRYKYFIQTVAESGELWTVIDSDGNFTLEEIENETVLSFWTHESFIESNLTPDWKDCIPYKLDMDGLENVVIPLIRQNNYLINVFPVESRTGYLINLADFIMDVNDALSKY